MASISESSLKRSKIAIFLAGLSFMFLKITAPLERRQSCPFSHVRDLTSAIRDLIKVCEFAIEKCTTLDTNAERIMKSLSIVYLDCCLSL